jgi:hypothetical protein
MALDHRARSFYCTELTASMAQRALPMPRERTEDWKFGGLVGRGG